MRRILCTKAVVVTGRDLYVATTGNDNNPGTQNSPFRTIGKGASVAIAGDRIHVASGTYSERVVNNASGNANARIAFISDVKWGAKIIFAGTNDKETFRNNGAYVDIIGFDITNTADYTGGEAAGLYNYNSYVRVINCYIHDCKGSVGIDNWNSGYTLHNIDCIGNVVCRNGTTDHEHGIYISYNYSNILNNIVFGNSGYGIHGWHACSNAIICNNLTFDNGDTGIMIGQGDSGASTGADNCIVNNNISIDNHNRGIAEEGLVGTHNTFRNNDVLRNTNENWRLLSGTQIDSLSVDPKFVNYKVDGTGDYHLAAGSPLIDAGTSVNAPSTDIDGRGRPQGNGFDIGPYEF